MAGYHIKSKYPTSFKKTKKNAIVEYIDYQIPVTQLKGPKGKGDLQAAKRDKNAPPTGGRQI